MDIQPERIKEIDCHQLPVLFKIQEHHTVAVAVSPEIALHRRQLQNRRDKEAAGQREKHTVDDLPVENLDQKQGDSECRCHARQKVDRNLLVVLTDRQIQHGVKHEHQRDVAAEAGEHENQVHLPHHMLPDAEGNAQKTAQQNIQKQPDVKARHNVLVALLIDDIRHVPREHRVKGCRSEQRKDEYVQQRPRKQAPSGVADAVIAEDNAHQHDRSDYQKHGRNRDDRTVHKSRKMRQDRPSSIYSL